MLRWYWEEVEYISKGVKVFLKIFGIQLLI